MFQSGQPVKPNPRSPEMDAGRHCGLCSFTRLPPQCRPLDLPLKTPQKVCVSF
jgi:hypothetical protein